MKEHKVFVVETENEWGEWEPVAGANANPQHTDAEEELRQDQADNPGAKLRIAPYVRAASFFILLLCAALRTSAQTTGTITGVIKDLTGAVVPTGKVTFSLRPGADTTISGIARFTNSTVTCTINQASVATNQAVRAGNSVTISGLTNHTFIANDVITITGMTDSTFNGTFTIGSVTASSITYPQAQSNATSGGGVVSALRGGAPNGTTAGSCILTLNTALNPPGTSYLATVYPANTKTSQFGFYLFTSSLDLTTVVPTPAQMPFYSFVDTFSNQTIAGNKTFTGQVSLAVPPTTNIQLANIPALTTRGDLLRVDATPALNRLAIAANASLLASNGLDPFWLTPGTNGQALTISGGNLTWATLGASALTNRGDLLTINAALAQARLAIGTTGQVVTTTNGLDPSWGAAGPAALNMTTTGDLVQNNAGTLARIGVGSNGQCLTSNGTLWVPGSCTQAGSVGDGQLSTNVVFKDEQLAGRANENVTFGHTAAPASFSWFMKSQDGGGVFTFASPDSSTTNTVAPQLQFKTGASNGLAGGVDMLFAGGNAGTTGANSGGYNFTSGTCTATNCQGGDFQFNGTTGHGNQRGSAVFLNIGAASGAGGAAGFMQVNSGTSGSTLPPIISGINNVLIGVANNRAVVSEGVNTSAASPYHYLGSNVVNNCPFQGPSGHLTGNSLDQTFLSGCTIKANQMLAGKGVRITAQFQHDSGTASVTYKFFFGGQQILSYADSGVAQVTVEFTIMNNPGSTNTQTILCKPILDGTTIIGSCGTLTSSVDTTIDENFSATFNVPVTDTVKQGAQLGELVN